MSRPKIQERLRPVFDILDTPARLGQFDFGVIAFAFGIALYFLLPFEPSLRASVIVLLFLFLVWAALSRFASNVPVIFILALCAVSGLTRATWHTDAVNTPKLPSVERAYSVTGWIEKVDRMDSRPRWVLNVKNVEGRNIQSFPKKIRLTTYGNNVKAGESVEIRAVLKAPPSPISPGSYDSGRAAYFSQIGAFGYAISPPQVLSDLELSAGESLRREFVKFRYGLSERIYTNSPRATAGLQVALLTGVRSYIPEAHVDSLRTAGLAHVLAISGLHMGLFAGGIYALSSFLLACIIPLSRRYDMRKTAAVLGGIAASFYLLLSGASVATQRAFIMVMIVFLAVILDRRAFSLRSVSLAAFVTLMFHPEALISAGFQMSFAAVTSLVVVYRVWDKHRSYDGFRPSFVSRINNGFTSLTVTSFVAGTATAGYAAIHFNRMATYGLLGNLIAMPIFTFWIMPSAIAVMIFLPFGFEELPLYVMGQGLSIMLFLSDWVSGLSGSLTFVSAAPSWLIGVYSVAFGLLCLGGLKQRAIGLGMMLVCLVGWYMSPRPDIRVSDQGVVTLWNGDSLIGTKTRSDRFGRMDFRRRGGNVDAVLNDLDGVHSCDVLACRVQINNQTLSVVHHPSEVLEACESSDLVILTKREAGIRAKRLCRAILLDNTDFRKNGSFDIYVTPASISMKPSNPTRRKSRPWGAD